MLSGTSLSNPELSSFMTNGQQTRLLNLKAVSRRLVGTWVLNVWKEISKEMIIQSLK